MDAELNTPRREACATASRLLQRDYSAQPILEAARMLVLAIVQRAERTFLQAEGRAFNLGSQADVLHMARLINFQDEVHRIELSFSDLHQLPVEHTLQRYDIAHGFLLKHLILQSAVFSELNFDCRTATIEGLLGRMYYNVPERHYHERADLLEQQIAHGNAPYIEARLKAFQNELRRLYRTVYDSTRPAAERRLIHDSFSDAFANILVITPLFYMVSNVNGALRTARRTLPEMVGYLRRPRERVSMYR